MTTIGSEEHRHNSSGADAVLKEWEDSIKKGATKFHLKKTAESASRLIEAMLEKSGIGGVKDEGTGSLHQEVGRRLAETMRPT